jgi:hypothetical protein
MVRGQALARLLRRDSGQVENIEIPSLLPHPALPSRPLTNGRIDAIGLRQHPLTPFFDFVDRRGTIECKSLWDHIPYFPLSRQCALSLP